MPPIPADPWHRLPTTTPDRNPSTTQALAARLAELRRTPARRAVGYAAGGLAAISAVMIASAQIGTPPGTHVRMDSAPAMPEIPAAPEVPAVSLPSSPPPQPPSAPPPTTQPQPPVPGSSAQPPPPPAPPQPPRPAPQDRADQGRTQQPATAAVENAPELLRSLLSTAAAAARQPPLTTPPAVPLQPSNNPAPTAPLQPASPPAAPPATTPKPAPPPSPAPPTEPARPAPPQPGPPPKPLAPAPPRLDYHTVRPGQTLSQIAHNLRTCPQQLKRLNQLPGDRIHPGDQLRLHEAVPARISRPTPRHAAVLPPKTAQPVPSQTKPAPPTGKIPGLLHDISSTPSSPCLVPVPGATGCRGNR